MEEEVGGGNSYIQTTPELDVFRAPIPNDSQPAPISNPPPRTF